ncbi:glycosyltransferase family 61 protein [Niallia sp. 01092]|uniref:glycosyltransferase family 61 protein n=1 Tax=unclassified Niallia TaxID=2837522 RepID=UPI003FD2FAC9
MKKDCEVLSLDKASNKGKSSRGYHNTTKDWIKKFKSAPKLYKSFPSTTAEFTQLPKGIEKISWSFMPQPCKQFRATIPWGKVLGDNGSVITPDNKLLWDVSFEYNKSPKKHRIFKEKELPPISFTSETLAVLTSQVSFNYYHWMFDVLPRLRMLNDASLEIDKYVINRGIYFTPEFCKYQDESFDILGIPKEKIIECDHNTYIQAKKLIVTSLAGYTAHVPKEVCQYIRYEFLNKLNLSKSKGNKRIFISREDAMHRKLLNEDKVFRVLEKYGFELVKLTELSLADKIKLFTSAEVVVSSHGAALTNIVFCNSGTKIIELFTPTYLLPCFYIISNYMNLDYYYLIGEQVEADDNRSFHSDPIYINLDKLERTLQLADIT